MRSDDFADRSRQLLRRLKRSAEELTDELGLPPETKFEVLYLMDQTSQATTAPAVATPLPPLPSLPAMISWVIESLFPRRASLGTAFGTLAGPGSPPARRGATPPSAQEHVSADGQLRLTARLIDKLGGILADLEVRLVSTVDGSPAPGVTVTLRQGPGAATSQTRITDAEGIAVFPDLRKAAPERWGIELQRSETP